MEPQEEIPRINNHLAGALVVTLLCCMPVGAVAVVYAARVDTLVFCGHIAEARENADKAKLWIMIAVSASLLWLVAVFFMAVFAAVVIPCLAA